MKRRTARENAFIAAFEAAFRPEDLEEIIAYSRECGEYALDEYGEQLLRAMAANTKQIDGMIEAKLKDWTLRRLPKVNVTILRLALAEMRFVPSEENMDSIVINEAVKFLEIPTHSLHISMELAKINGRPAITDRSHRESDLVCLLLLGGDLRRDENGILREWRIYNNELDTNMMKSLNFSDRKHHYSRFGDEESVSDVMEYKFLRLKSTETDYAKVIVALKAYQLETCARPISIPRMGCPELPEQTFLRNWAAHPQSLSLREIDDFAARLESGMCKERNSVKLDKRGRSMLENIVSTLVERNRSVAQG